MEEGGFWKQSCKGRKCHQLFTPQFWYLTILGKTAFENIVGKEAFSPFFTVFSTQVFQSHLFSANAFNLEKSEFLLFSSFPMFSTLIHAIIFSDKSGTKDFIFWDLHAFSRTDTTPPPPQFFFNYRPVIIFCYAETLWCKTVKKILLLDRRLELFSIFVLLIFR